MDSDGARDVYGLIGKSDTGYDCGLKCVMMANSLVEGAPPEQITCAGCDKVIQERYLHKVLDKYWHVECVKCSECHNLLSEKCYWREGKIFCRADFFR